MTNKEIFTKRYPDAEIRESLNFVEITFKGENTPYVMPIEWWNDEVFYFDHVAVSRIEVEKAVKNAVFLAIRDVPSVEKMIFGEEKKPEQSNNNHGIERMTIGSR